jgi:hypothetical protein
MDVPGLVSGRLYLELELVELLKGEVEAKRRAYGVHCEAESTTLTNPAGKGSECCWATARFTWRPRDLHLRTSLHFGEHEIRPPC